MPAIAYEERERTEEFIKLSGQSMLAGERNDCSVKAVAVALDISYNEAHDLCCLAGRKHGEGMYTKDILAAIQRSDKYLTMTSVLPVEMIARYPKGHRDVLRNVTTHHPSRFKDNWPEGVYLLFSRHHVTAVVDGVVHDWAKGRALRVNKIYQIFRKRHIVVPGSAV